MTGYYILDGKEPIAVSNVINWAIQFETADRIVKQTLLSQNVRVSTVFLGLNHRFGDGPPLLFETMVFGGEYDLYRRRYTTWEEAEVGHEAVIDELFDRRQYDDRANGEIDGN